jgi:transmembrane sensor
MKDSPAREDLLQMLKRYADGNASAAEKEFIEKYYEHFDKQADILDQYTPQQKGDLEHEMEAYLTAKIQPVEESSVKPLWSKSLLRLLTAASILFLVGVFVYKSDQLFPKNIYKAAAKPDDVAPGSDKAILTLSNGTSIKLDETSNGYVATDGHVSISSNGQGELEYSRNGKNSVSKVVGMNQIATPVGGQYRVVLPDGSKVWLNAMSSLSYPTFFEGSQRKVKVTGECYFEIAKDTRRPFVVEIDDKQRVVVTGTHFNVNAYPNESNIRTTLLEGAVEVHKIGDSSKGILKLKPGSQSYIGSDGRLKTMEVSAEEMVAWKNGLFYFKNADLATVMRQIERWYNVEVSYGKQIETKEFSGKIHRNVKLSQVLEILRFTGINMKVEAADKKDSNAQIVLMP